MMYRGPKNPSDVSRLAVLTNAFAIPTILGQTQPTPTSEATKAATRAVAQNFNSRNREDIEGAATCFIALPRSRVQLRELPANAHCLDGVEHLVDASHRSVPRLTTLPLTNPIEIVGATPK